MTEDEKQAAITRAGALAIGDWLEGRGRLGHPIRSLTLDDLDAMAANAIAAAFLKRDDLLRLADAPEDTAFLFGA